MPIRRPVPLAGVLAVVAASCGILPLPPGAAAQQQCSAMTANFNLALGDAAAPSLTLAGAVDTNVAGLQRLRAKSVLRQNEDARLADGDWSGHGPNDPAILCFLDSGLPDGGRVAIGYVIGDESEQWAVVDYGTPNEVPVAAP